MNDESTWALTETTPLVGYLGPRFVQFGATWVNPEHVVSVTTDEDGVWVQLATNEVAFCVEAITAAEVVARLSGEGDGT